MDPTECLRQLLAACDRFTEEENHAFSDGGFARALGAATTMRDQVTALNTWLTNGGYLPQSWDWPYIGQKT